VILIISRTCDAVVQCFGDCGIRPDQRRRGDQAAQCWRDVGGHRAVHPQRRLHGTDTVILSATQRSAVWNDLSKQAANQNVAGFDAMIGTFVPIAVKMEPIPNTLTANNPSLRPYDFAMVNHKLVIVDPSNKVIANVLSKPRSS
jgi:hypothetical protein